MKSIEGEQLYMRSITNELRNLMEHPNQEFYFSTGETPSLIDDALQELGYYCSSMNYNVYTNVKTYYSKTCRQNKKFIIHVNTNKFFVIGKFVEE